MGKTAYQLLQLFVIFHSWQSYKPDLPNWYCICSINWYKRIKNVYFSSWCWFTLKNFAFPLLRWFKESLKSFQQSLFYSSISSHIFYKESPELAKDVTSSNRQNSYLNPILSYISRIPASSQTVVDSLSCMYFKKLSYVKLSFLLASILYTFYGFYFGLVLI